MQFISFFLYAYFTIFIIFYRLGIQMVGEAGHTQTARERERALKRSGYDVHATCRYAAN